MTHALEVVDLTCGYGDLTVVRNVSLTVEPATITAVLGRNGAGKTTTLRAIAGLLPLKSGEVRLHGESINGVPAYARRRLGFGYVQENKRIFRQRTVEENLLMGVYGLGMKRAEEQRRIREAYDRFPILSERHDQPAGYLSGGQQQMLAIGQALLSKPSVLMLDEPSSGLAPSIVNEVMQTVRNLRDEEGMSVLLIEQVVSTTLAVADNVVVLDIGRVMHAGPADYPGLAQIVENAYMANTREDS
ncbi:ABC transporter ATP-binding protein [Microbacterium sp. NPDC077644]|uniref:ABC transporter ATP-binding protein n=1 Tax=Microbacterium sp. NPDC077644 TaxID=3155055 RepID=UPI00344BEC0B